MYTFQLGRKQSIHTLDGYTTLSEMFVCPYVLYCAALCFICTSTEEEH
jgi:hypothetical protein